jgi:CheY-like chemotaxis protein
MTTILIIDDSKLSRTMTKRALIEAGYETIEADNGRVGLQMLKEHQPDCITLDLLMPEMDGQQVLAAMRDEGIGIPVVVVTANIQEDVRKECLALGAFDVINKPNMRGEEFVAVIANALLSAGE